MRSGGRGAVAVRSGGLGGRLTVALAIVLAALLVFVGARQAGAAEGPAVVSIADTTLSVKEGNAAGDNSATVTINLSQAATDAVTVDYKTTDGTAKQPDDYTQTNGSVTIAAGETSATVAVPINGNTTQDDDRAFTVTISLPEATDPAVATLDSNKATATVTIVDDDWVIRIAPEPSNGKAAANGGKVDFVVSLRNDAAAPQDHKIKFDYKVANDSAKLGTDYALTDPTDPTGTLTFAAGEKTKHIKITGIDDGVYSADKTFTVTISSPVGARLANGAGDAQVGTITENRAPPLVGITDCTDIVKAGNDAQFLVRTSAVSQLPAALHYTTVDDSTTADDFDHVTNGDVVIAPGQTSTTIAVHTKANPPDGDRKFHVQLSDPQNVTLLSAGASRADCTIRNTGNGGGGSTLGTVQITGPDAVVEPAAGTTVNDTFTVTYTPPAALPPNPPVVTVTWATHDGSATSPADYTGANGTVTWTGGTFGDKPITIKVNGVGSPPDTDQESFSVSITATNANVSGTGSATATILPQNTTAPLLSVADASGSENSGAIPVRVTLSTSSAAPVTVHYATEDGTATAGSDYTAATGDLTFAPGDLTKTISIPITDNSTPERDKTFTLRLSGASGAVISKAAATVTILNDDALPPAVPRANPFLTPLPAPVPLPTQQPTPQAGQTHFVLAGIVNGQSKVDARGRASFRISCPAIVKARCKGTVRLEVRIMQKPPKGSKAKPKLTTIRVGNGSFTINAGKVAAVPIKLTAQGLSVLKSLHRIKVKATVTATDATGVKGVTAWIVALVEPPRHTQISIKTR